MTIKGNVNDKMRYVPLDTRKTGLLTFRISACVWYVLEIPDGNSNVKAIVTSLEHADAHSGQPMFIKISTIIGHSTSIAGTCKAH